MSHPTWVRGLKQMISQLFLSCMRSHPTWVRGLKQIFDDEKKVLLPSHPTWVRGLKLKRQYKTKRTVRVAPYVGAWIETSIVSYVLVIGTSRTLRGCVD